MNVPLNKADMPTLLCFLHWVVGILQKFGNNRLDVLTHVSSLSESGAVANCKRNIKAASQRLCKQGFSLEIQKQKHLNHFNHHLIAFDKTHLSCKPGCWVLDVTNLNR